MSPWGRGARMQRAPEGREMPNRWGNIVRSGLVALVVLVVVVAIGAGAGLDGPTILYASVWGSTLLVAAAGVFLIVRGARPVAGAGAIVAAAAAWLPFFYKTPVGATWTVPLIVGIALIAWGTRPDVGGPWAGPLLIARFAVGWAFLDNGVQDQVWAPNGGGFLVTATGSAGRAPLDFIDPAYHSFLQSTVIPHPSAWAGLFLGGEVTFGLLVAVGLFTQIAAWGAMWLSANIILEKSFITHGSYVDKTYFLLEVVALATASGRAYGLDAALERHLPPRLAGALSGATGPAAADGALGPGMASARG